MIRYRYIEHTVLNIYKSLPFNLLVFPLDMVKIIKCLDDNCKLWSYQYYSKVNNMSVVDIINFTKSQSGCTIYNPQTEQYLILFNKSSENYNVEGRKTFTLAHEFGHIRLKHLTDISEDMIAEENILSLKEKPILEQEADYFAVTFLAPLPLFKLFNISSPIDVQKTFGLSTMASGYRFKDYLKWQRNHINTSWENDVMQLFNK